MFCIWGEKWIVVVALDGNLHFFSAVCQNIAVTCFSQNVIVLIFKENNNNLNLQYTFQVHPKIRSLLLKVRSNFCLT